MYKADALMNGKQLDIIFNVTDVEGTKGSERKSIKIIKDISELEVKRLSLILFDVSSDQIPKHAIPGVSELLKSLDDFILWRLYQTLLTVIGNPLKTHKTPQAEPFSDKRYNPASDLPKFEVFRYAKITNNYKGTCR